MSLQTAALRELETSFPPVELQPDAVFGGNGTTYLGGSAFIAGARGQTWRTLDKEFLEYHHDAMMFLLPAAFIEYLPAYLTAVASGGDKIRNLPTFLRSALTRTRDPAWFDARIGLLPADQQRAVARVLVEIERSRSTELDKEEMTEVIDSHWRDIAQEGSI